MDDLESGGEMDVSGTVGTKRSLSSVPSSELMDNLNEGNSVEVQSLVMFHVATAGRQDEEAGTDEYPVVLITAKRVDLDFPERNHPEFQCIVRPCMALLPNTEKISTEESAEQANVAPNEVDVEEPNEDATGDAYPVYTNVVLSMECRESTGLCDGLVSDAPLLAEALEQLRTWITAQDLTVHDLQSNNVSEIDTEEAHNTATHGDSHQTKKARQERPFQLVLDGPLHLRSILHPEATRNAIDLSNQPYLYQYIDLRKLCRKVFNTDEERICLTQIIEAAGIDRYTMNGQRENESGFVEDNNMVFAMHRKLIPVTTAVSTNSQNETRDYYQAAPRPGQKAVEHCRMMAALTIYLHKNGASWNQVETISKAYQPAIVRKSELVDDSTVVRARGLPWQATDLDIFHFFTGLNIADGGISLVLSKVGRRNGEALIRFVDNEQRQLALKRHKHHMGQRYIEVYAALGRDFIAYAGAETLEAEQFLEQFTSPYQAVIRMRGLPYNANADQILQFFETAQCAVQFGEQGVLFVNRPDGRATGDAFVLFESQAVAERALLNHRKHIGNRYIELFKSTPAEVNQVMNSACSPTTQQPNWSGLPIDPEAVLSFAALVSNGLLGSATKDAIDLRSRLAGYLPALDQPGTLVGHYTHTPHASNLLLPSVIPTAPSMLQQTLDSSLCNPELLGASLGFPYNPTMFISNPALYNDPNGPVQLSTANNGPLAVLRNFVPQPQVVPQWSVKLTPGGLSSFPANQLSLEQMVRCYVRIRGMPTDADIMDILLFLDDQWQHVALHGVHHVYDSMGQPTGEAIIQFISDVVAQSVVELKNGTLFIKRGITLHTSCYVEVTHCTVEDLLQLLNTLMTFCQPTGQLSPLYPTNGIRTMPFSATGSAIVQQPAGSSPAMLATNSCLSNIVLTQTGRPDLLTSCQVAKPNLNVSLGNQTTLANPQCPPVITLPIDTNQAQNLVPSFIQNGSFNSYFPMNRASQRSNFTITGHGSPCAITSANSLPQGPTDGHLTTNHNSKQGSNAVENQDSSQAQTDHPNQ